MHSIINRFLRYSASVASFFSLQLAIEAQDRILIDDPLINGSEGERFEGEYTRNGYAPRTRSGHILYRPSYWPEHCTVSFEAKGIGGFPGHIDWDPAFLAVYDGRGIEEPAPHGNDFKNNFFRFNLHWRTDKEAIKCVINCAADTDSRRSAVRAVFENDKPHPRDWLREPNGKSVEWDDNQWYEFIVVWTPESVTVTLDGIEKWSVELDSDHPYRPIEPRIWLGSAPRGNLGGEHRGREKYANHYPDSLYRNFKMIDSSLTARD